MAALAAASLLLACAEQQHAAPPPGAAPSPAAGARTLAGLPRFPGPQTVSIPARAHPAVAVRLHFLTGSVDDPPGKEGLTALTAHLMAEGGTANLSSGELLRALFPMAADISAQVEKETTVLEGHCPSDALARCLPLLEEVVLRPRFDPRELERIRNRMVDFVEKSLRSESDEELAKETLSGMLYAGHPYGHFTGGTVEGLRRITLEDVKAHYSRVFVRARLTVGAAGGFEGDLALRIARDLAALPQGTLPAGLPPPAASGPRFVIVEKESMPAAISMGFTWPIRRGHPDFLPLAVAVSALGEHRQGAAFRLFRALREERGLNYGDYAYPEHFEQSGEGALPEVNEARSYQEFTVWIRPVEPAHQLFAIRAALYELDRWAKSGLSADELERVRRFLAGYTLMFDQTDSRRLGYALDDRFYGLPQPWLATFRAALPSLTVEQVNAAIRRHVDLSRLRIAIATHGANELARALVAGAPSPMTYTAPKPDAILAEDREIERFPLGVRGPADVKVVGVEELFQR